MHNVSSYYKMLYVLMGLPLVSSGALSISS
uniref:Uncharacterized protein n=1 Tax=Anguilla anguilla TaxID=7936 RepID=A0A0E9VPQ0_ANGAN